VPEVQEAQVVGYCLLNLLLVLDDSLGSALRGRLAGLAKLPAVLDGHLGKDVVGEHRPEADAAYGYLSHGSLSVQANSAMAANPPNSRSKSITS
jgi:hypothetical protein